MYKVIVVMDILEEHKSVLESVSPLIEITYKRAAELVPEDIKDVDLIVGNLAPELLVHCQNLKLLQLNNAGTDGFTDEGVIPSGALLANATGAYGLAISEYMIGALLILMKKFNIYQRNQDKRLWHSEGQVRTMYNSDTLVVGFGDIGSEFAVRMHVMGSKVTGIKRRASTKPDYLVNLYTMDKFYDALGQADIVASCLPGTPQTYKIYDKKAFDAMRPGAYFINIGRGKAVDNDALIEALESGKLAGAILDVTDPEPLPANSRLWEMENVIITPHISGGYRQKESHDRIIEIAARNMSHLVNGEPFENLVDMQTGYKD